MNNILNHIIDIDVCSLYSAREGASIKPAIIKENYEIVEILTAGQIIWEENGETRIYNRGTIFWHQSGEHTICRYPKGEAYSCGVFHFNVTSPRPCPRVGQWIMPLDLDIFIADSINMFHSKQLPPEVVAQYCFGMLVRQMFSNTTLTQSYPRVLQRALKLIDVNLSSAISVEFIANYCDISKGHLFLLFNQHMGVSPHRYILERQLAKARTLLVSEDCPIKEIAHRCGFDTLEVFYRQFSRSCKIPPGEYRRQNSIQR